MKSFTTVLAGALLLATSAFGQGTPSAEGAKVYIVNLEDGATVSSPVTVIFGLQGMGVAPAGVEKENTGHHHLILDRVPFGTGEFAEAELVEGIPADENHKHFGGGQTQTTLELAPGSHTLQLVLGDANHIPHDPPVMSAQITITVE
ncbi:MAG: DUF4399 domain-containing protein [Pseudomonadota bacterium]